LLGCAGYFLSEVVRTVLLLNWDAACAAGPTAAGGKGWNLGRLHRYGFAVPRGGVVGAEAYRRYLQHPDLHDLLAQVGRLAPDDLTTPESGALLAALREAMVAAPLPAAVAGELHGFLMEAGLLHTPVAVRSSATAEDSATASFAGIHQSYLNVTGLPAVTDALKRCYASLWTPQALVYRRKLGLPDERVAAAVVVLEMVTAQAAGVCFTCDPRTGSRDRFAISAAPGLGEAVVSGATEPDEYQVGMDQYPPPLLSRNLGRKIRMSVARKDEGTELVDVAPEAAAKPALTAQQVLELALLAARVQDALGQGAQPQDIEWAHDGRQFWLLQARPVTSLPEPTFPAIAGQPVVWSNANLRDVVPGVLSAMTWSFTRGAMDILMGTQLRAVGYEYHAGGINWIRLFEGRAYFNLSAMQYAFWDAFGIAPGDFNQMLGGHQPEIALPSSTWKDQVRREIDRLRLVGKTLAALKHAPAEFKRQWAWAEQAEIEPYDQWSNRQCLDRSLELRAITEAYIPLFQLVNGGAGGIHQELIKLLTPAFGRRAPGLVNAMLAGSKGITSAEQGERLVELGNLALREERTRAWFAAPDYDPHKWRERLDGTLCAGQFEAYLREYGHRGVYELEIANPRWKEDPSYLLDTVRSQVQSGREIQIGDRTATREAARREVFDKLGFGPRRLQVEYYLKQAALAAAHREMAKSVLVKLMSVTRYVGLSVGRRMVGEGLLDAPADVFHLFWTDLEAYLTGRPGLHGLRPLVADRKALRTEHLQKEPPDVILGETPVKKAPVVHASGPVLTGTGVATGTASGRARVILHPEEGVRLQPGEVLVAPSTDPAWTPLFLRASAVVMEVGGYLSHGAIVAREYGLPAVANIPGLLQAVADGETLTVDGDAGLVYRER
jgi:rifampicin phosphotransferase